MTDFDSIHMVWPNATPEIQKKIQFYHDLDVKSRGSFLIQANWIESDIDGILALAFCGNNKSNLDLIRSTLLKRLTFDAKIDSLNKIIKLRYKGMGEKDVKTKPLFDNLANNLETIRKFRNKLAHSSLSLTDDFITKDPKDRIPIRTYDDGKEKYLEIMKKEIEDKLAVTTEILIAMRVMTKYMFSEFNNDTKKP
ncbi:MAG: hypothetical protein K5793_02480 [Nitrosarchaeum sp.]|nr:hypothetical protein [Nitrosarchaeum sp.]